MAVREMPPRGHYLAQEVGFLAGVSGPMIGQWAKNGYIRSSQSEASPRRYSYQDVAEAMVVHELFERTKDYDQIRSTIESLRERFGADWPLTYSASSLGTFGTRKRRRIAFEDSDYSYDLGKGWQRMDDRYLTVISLQLSFGGWPARKLRGLQHIEVDPDRLSGAPTIRGRRVSAISVAELGTTQKGVQVLKTEYDLNADQIKDAKRWWKKAQQLAA